MIVKIRRDIVDYIYFGVFGLFIILFLTGQFANLTGTTLVVIDNSDPNSMFPTYFQGDLFIIHKNDPTSIEVGDVIVYENTRGHRVIHRVIDIVEANGQHFFRVKGDNPVTNYPVDTYDGSTLIPFDAVLGKTVVRIPYIGHLSLAMQQNPIVKVLIYIIAFAVGIAIMLWPEDEDEEVEKYYEINKEAWNELKGKINAILQSILRAFTISRFKLVAWSLLVILLIAGFLPFFMPTFLAIDSHAQIGVTEVDIEENLTINEPLKQASVRYYNLTVYLFDDTSYFQHIDGYTMQIKTSSGEVIDETVWNTRRAIKGSFTVGGAISIDLDIYEQLSSGEELTMEVIVELDKVIGSTYLSPYVETFTVKN